MTTELDDFKNQVIIAGCVLAGVVLLLLCLVLAAFYWLYDLRCKINKLDPLINFTFKRPKLNGIRATRNEDNTRSNDFLEDRNLNQYTFSKDNFAFGDTFVPDFNRDEVPSAPASFISRPNHNNQYY